MKTRDFHLLCPAMKSSPHLDRTAKRRVAFALVLTAWLTPGLALQAGLPEPDAVFYGVIALDGSFVTAADADVTVELSQTEQGPVVATYRMGDDPGIGDRYVLRATVESSAPVNDPAATALGGSVWLAVRQGGLVRDQRSHLITTRGEFVNLNFGDADSDGDGMSDAFEELYFGSTTGGDPDADPDLDGRPNRREFLDGTNPLVADGRHPADLIPADDRLNIQEVTEYALAWKLGEDWTVEPFNIPVDYVTRASALWVAGEHYIFDNDPPTTAPLWWVSNPDASSPDVTLPLTDAEPAAADFSGAEAATVRAELLSAARSWSKTRSSARARHGLTDSLVERVLPWNYTPNQPFRVTLTVTPGSDTRAFAVEESPPEGWLVRFVTASGRYDARNKLIKWGPFHGPHAQTLTYEVTPLGDPSTGGFTGVGSFDGSSATTQGRLAVYPPGSGPVASLSVESGPAGTYLTLFGLPGQSYFIEAGAELGVWLPLEPLTTDAQGQARLEFAPENEARFFRLRPQ